MPWADRTRCGCRRSRFNGIFGESRVGRTGYDEWEKAAGFEEVVKYDEE
jgi:hypothetical protein